MVGTLLPYPSDNLVLDVVLMLLFLGLETLRIFYGETNLSGCCWRSETFLTRNWMLIKMTIIVKTFMCLTQSLNKIVIVACPSGWKGNLCERSLASCVSLFILVPCVALAVYVLLLQTFILRFEFILAAILLVFYGLELLFGLVSLLAFSR